MSGDIENLMRLLGMGKKKAAKKPADPAKPESIKVDDPLANADLTPDKAIDVAVSGSEAKKAADKARKKKMIWGGAAGGVLLLALLIYMAMQPAKGNLAYGVCKTFIELNVRFPTTLRLSTVEEMGSSVRVWYGITDTFGAYRLELVQCYFKADPSGQLPFLVDRIAQNRRDLESTKIEKFNRILPSILASPLDLTLPAPLPDSLGGIQFETDKFRMKIF